MKKVLLRLPRIVIQLETSIKANRQKLRGIFKYANLYGPWDFHLIGERAVEQKLLHYRKWGGTGIITDGYDPELMQRAVESRLPVVIIDPPDYTLPLLENRKFNRVDCDSFAVGEMGARYLWEHNFKNFAFVGAIHNPRWSNDRAIGFSRYLSEQGVASHVYGTISEEEKSDWAVEEKYLRRWLLALPKPIAIMAAMDVRGRQILEVCRKLGFNIPYEISVLGVDNDELLCQSTNPPLSSIVTDEEGAGFLAAKILDDRMKRRNAIPVAATYDPISVESRRSTEAIMIPDKLVVSALEFIWMNSGITISSTDVVKHLGYSKRMVELRFRKAMGHSIMDEIQKVRLERIRSLLQGTDLSIGEISRICGYESESYLGKIFKARFGITMSEYRSEKMDTQ